MLLRIAEVIILKKGLVAILLQKMVRFPEFLGYPVLQLLFLWTDLTMWDLLDWRGNILNDAVDWMYEVLCIPTLECALPTAVGILIEDLLPVIEQLLAVHL